MTAPSTATVKTAKPSALPSASTSPDLGSQGGGGKSVRASGISSGIFWVSVGVALCLFLCGSLFCRDASAAEIVARIDGAIVTEHDVAERSLLLQKRLANLVPALRLAGAERRAFALDLLLQEALQKKHLVKERALPVTESAVNKRLSLLGTGRTGKAERLRLRELAELELTWEGYVGRVAQFNNPVTPDDVLEERARLRASAEQPRYRLEEIFLPRLAAGEATRKVADALYRSLRARGGSFARVKAVLPAPYGHEGLATQSLEKSALPPAVIEALEQGKVAGGGIVAPVRSPYGMHIYRVVRERGDKKTTRYGFVQTVFLQSGYGAQQAAILSDRAFCGDPQARLLSLAAYDLQAIEDVPQNDLDAETLRLFATMSVGQTAGPFPFAEGLIVLITLCDRQRVAERGDSFQQLNSTLQLQRARALSLRLVENLRAQASIEKQAEETLSALPER